MNATADRIINDEPSYDLSAVQLSVRGDWLALTVPAIQKAFATLTPKTDTLTINGAGVGQLDSAGAWLLMRTFNKWRDSGVALSMTGFRSAHSRLLSLVDDHAQLAHTIPTETHPGFFEHIGRDAMETLNNNLAFLAFIGRLTFSSLRIALTPAQLRWSSVVKHIEEAGFDGMPIVGLLTFLLGVVIAYQGGLALQTYGASIYTADFVGLSMVRELSPLLTAIIVAGRTGSAYTAQIATMKVTEEVDALRTLGISPLEELALPKFFALLVSLPLLTVFGDVMGLLGGMVMANSLLDVSFTIFIDRITQTVSATDVLVGVCKAPVFALMIAAVGCYHGFQVRAGAEQVGRQTTVSVVQAIFLVIVTDAAFSVVFSKLGI